MKSTYYTDGIMEWQTGHHDESTSSTAESYRRRLCCNVECEADMIVRIDAL